MNSNETGPFVFVVFNRFTVPLMLSVGLLLRETVARAPALPAYYAHVWDPFFERLDELYAASIRRSDPPMTPETTLAIEAIKEAIRSLEGILSARAHARDAEVRDAAHVLTTEFFSDGKDIVNQPHHELFASANLLCNRMQGPYANDVTKARVGPEVSELDSAQATYLEAVGDRAFLPDPDAPQKTMRERLDATREALRWVMIELTHAMHRHPEHEQTVRMMVGPLKAMSSKVRDAQKKKRAAPTPTPSANDASKAKATSTAASNAS